MELSQKESQAIQPKSFVNKVNASQNKGHPKSNHNRSRSLSRGRDVSKSNRSTSGNRPGFKECRRCGRKHNPNTCPAVNWKCYVCQKIGHISKMCFNKESSGCSIPHSLGMHEHYIA